MRASILPSSRFGSHFLLDLTCLVLYAASAAMLWFSFGSEYVQTKLFRAGNEAKTYQTVIQNIENGNINLGERK